MRELAQQRPLEDHAILKALIAWRKRVEFSIRALAPEKAKTGCLVLGVYKQGGDGAPRTAPRAGGCAKCSRRAT
jgi:hypothetical protein